jgi:cystathionine beta-lyase/cystathionine gamma-synthase
MKFNTKVYTVANIQTQAQGCHPYIKQRLMHKQVLDILWEYEYSRTANPTRTALENALARMAQEDWPSSGFSNRLFDAGLKPGDEVITWMICMGELTDCLRKFIKIQVYYSICRHE